MTLGRTLTNRPRGRMRKEEMRESLSSANKEYHQQGFVGTRGPRDGSEFRAGVQTQGTKGGGPVRQTEKVISRSPSKHKRTEEKQRTKD